MSKHDALIAKLGIIPIDLKGGESGNYPIGELVHQAIAALQSEQPTSKCELSGGNADNTHQAVPNDVVEYLRREVASHTGDAVERIPPARLIEIARAALAFVKGTPAPRSERGTLPYCHKCGAPAEAHVDECPLCGVSPETAAHCPPEVACPVRAIRGWAKCAPVQWHDKGLMAQWHHNRPEIFMRDDSGQWWFCLLPLPAERPD